MKDQIGKSGIDKLSFLQTIVIDKNEIVAQTKTGNKFKNFFINIGFQIGQKTATAKAK